MPESGGNLKIFVYLQKTKLMNEIKKLDNPWQYPEEDGPTEFEVIDKINEIIEAVNRMEKQIEKLQLT